VHFVTKANLVFLESTPKRDSARRFSTLGFFFFINQYHLIHGLQLFLILLRIHWDTIDFRTQKMFCIRWWHRICTDVFMEKTEGQKFHDTVPLRLIFRYPFWTYSVKNFRSYIGHFYFWALKTLISQKLLKFRKKLLCKLIQSKSTCRFFKISPHPPKLRRRKCHWHRSLWW
jgi:hypothetical protein